MTWELLGADRLILSGFGSFILCMISDILNVESNAFISIVSVFLYEDTYQALRSGALKPP